MYIHGRLHSYTWTKKVENQQDQTKRLHFNSYNFGDYSNTAHKKVFFHKYTQGEEDAFVSFYHKDALFFAILHIDYICS